MVRSPRTRATRRAHVGEDLERPAVGLQLGTPPEVAKALFLASDDSSCVNGSELFVDGWQAQV